MILTIALYDTDEGTRYQAVACDDAESEPVDVTEQYMIVATETEDGRKGFSVIKREFE